MGRFVLFLFYGAALRRCIVPLVFLICLPVVDLAAQLNVDSLMQTFVEIEEETQRLTVMDSICTKLMIGHERNAGPVFEARMELAEKIGGFEKNVKRAIDGADYYLRTQNAEKATAHVAAYLEQVDLIKDIELKLNLLDLQAAIHSEADEFEPAVKLYQEIIEISSQAHEPPIQQKASSYRNLGKVLYGKGSYGESSIVLNQARDMALEQKDSAELSTIYLELGNLFGRIGLYDEAINYFKERHKYFSTPSKIDQLIDYSNFGNAKLAQESYAEALPYFRAGLREKPYPMQWEMIELYYLTGLVEGHYFLDQRDSVIHYFQLMEDAYERLDRSDVYQFLYQQSQYFYLLISRQYARAERILNDLFAESQKYNNDAELLKYSLYYSELYRRWNKPKQALEYLDVYNEINDSIQTSNKLNALLLYQTQYETKEKENTIQTLQTEQEIQQLEARATRNRLLGGTLILLLLGGVLFTRQYYRNKMQRAVQIERLRNKISSDLHDDVGSILTGLAMQTEIMENVAQAEQKPKLRRISELSRSAMSRMRDAVWAMDARKDNWRSLIDRMYEFAEESLEVKEIHFELKQEGIDGDKNLPADVRQSFYLIFKEALSNILKHSDADRVETQLTENAQKMEMIIRDNGRPKIKNHSAGLGLSNMKMRAEQINAHLEIRQEDGFWIILRKKKA